MTTDTVPEIASFYEIWQLLTGHRKSSGKMSSGTFTQPVQSSHTAYDWDNNRVKRAEPTVSILHILNFRQFLQLFHEEHVHWRNKHIFHCLTKLLGHSYLVMIFLRIWSKCLEHWMMNWITMYVGRKEKLHEIRLTDQQQLEKKQRVKYNLLVAAPSSGNDHI